MGENFAQVNIDKEVIERERQSKVFSRFLHFAKNIESLHGESIEDVFSGEEKKRKFLNALKPDEFIKILNGINGILRNKPKEDWEMDGENVVLEGILMGVGYVPPGHEDKPKLLTEVLTAAKEMNQSGKELKDIALLVSSTLNAIHAYSDGNGRTSRLIYSLLAENLNSDTKVKLSEILAKYGRDKIDINPGSIQWIIERFAEKDLGLTNPEINTDNITNLFGYKKDIQFGEGIIEKDKNLFSTIFQQDPHNLFLAVFQFLKIRNDKEKFVKKFTGRSAIPITSLTKNIDQEGLKQIFENYRDLKNQSVKKLIDIIAHPEKEEYQIEHEGEKMSLKDYFELEMKEKSERNAEEDRLSEERKNK